MNNALNELNQAIQNIDWSEPKESECRFYYDSVTNIGTQINGNDCSDPFVVISREDYDLMSSSVASKFYLSKTGEVKPIPVARGAKKMLECSTDGPYRTLKDCMIFADPAGPDSYRRRENDYD